MTLSSDSIAPPIGSDRTAAPVGLARAALFWERVWVRLWPATGVFGVLLAAALAGLFEPLPWIFHALLMAVAVTAAGLLLDRAFADFRLPRWDDGARRIETQSGLSDRPLTEGQDVLAAGHGDPYAEALWRETLRRRLAAARNLRVGWPSPGLAARDPRALRYVVLLLIAASALVANTDWRERLGRAFLASDNATGVVAGLDAWVDPPGYTGLPPVYLSPTMRGPISVPAGSRLNIRVHGSDYAPILGLSPSPASGGDVTGKNGEYASSAVLASDSTVRLRASGRTIGYWNLRVVPDVAPSIAFTGKPGKTERLALKIPFKASDDYGVTSVRVSIVPTKRKGVPISVEIALPSLSARSVDETAYRDLTAHPYAGLPVAITLEARDGAGQVARSAAMQMILPARVFTNPLARALVEQRQNLASDNKTAPAVLLALDALTIAPDLFYADKKDIFKSLRGAFDALKRAKNGADYGRVEDTLWQVALALEQGGLLNAAQELRRIQELLTEALAAGAPQEVIDALLQRYNQAMQRYMQLLAQNPQAAQQGPPPPDAKSLSMEDLQTLLKIIQQMAAAGNREGAARALALLQGLIENLRMSQGGGSGGSAQDKQLSDGIKKLGDLMGQQRNLLDKTYRQQQGNGDPKDGGPKGLSQQQQQLHRQLDDAMKGLGGKNVAPLNKAGREMGNAENQLGGNDTDSAVDSEKNALDAMRQGADALAQKLMQQMGQKSGQGGNEDPLGREQGARGPSFGKGVKVPSQSELERARNILQELRRRAAERGRPQEELDYIDRLLKQF